jgi:hypothetical protein
MRCGRFTREDRGSPQLAGRPGTDEVVSGTLSVSRSAISGYLRSTPSTRIGGGKHPSLRHVAASSAQTVGLI